MCVFLVVCVLNCGLDFKSLVFLSYFIRGVGFFWILIFNCIGFLFVILVFFRILVNFGILFLLIIVILIEVVFFLVELVVEYVYVFLLFMFDLGMFKM